jgi:hypothetical protein
VQVKDEYIAGVTPGAAADYDWWHSVSLTYAKGGLLHLALWGRYKVDANGNPIASTYESGLGGGGINGQGRGAREFRYTSPGELYMTIDFGVDTPDHGQGGQPQPWWFATGIRYTEHVDGEPYVEGSFEPEDGDGPYAPDSFVADRQYFGSSAEAAVPSGGGAPAQRYRHADMAGSTHIATNEGGALATSWGTGGGGGSGGSTTIVAYTAFGELITRGDPPAAVDPEQMGTRYQYAGEYGYESGLLSLQGVNTTLPPLTFQHLGYRWYQPDIGRSVQRGVVDASGGMNQFTDQQHTGVIRIFIRAFNGLVKLINRATGVHHARNGRRVYVEGPGAKRAVKRLAEEAWPGKRVVHHDSHGPGQHPHYQPSSGGGHVFYVLRCVATVMDPFFLTDVQSQIDDIISPQPEPLIDDEDFRI